MNKLNANKYREMLLYGGEILNAKKEEINALNVFPVPDGDTGSNMNMTTQSGVQAISNINPTSIGEVAKVFSKGLLMGARGNSGVILSQFFRGIAEGLEGKEEISVQEFHQALESGVKRAYGSIIKVVEGTILTVVREMTENTTDFNMDFEDYFQALYDNAKTSLDNTPELLPVLKEVGVVDSGGAGFLAILEGMLANLKGEEIEIKENFELFRQTEEHPMNPEDIVFGYCTEMLIRLNDKNDEDKLNEIRSTLETFGDSIVCIIDDGILKVHVHTETPTKVFEYGQTFGDFIFIKSENMRIQAEDAIKLEESRRKELGLVAVASSQEMGDLFRSYCDDINIISGGQTLNPSTEDILTAIKACNAKDVILFPNNSNIIMASEAAVDLIDNVNVHIIKTKHMTQALECLMSFNVDASVEENVENMNNIISNMINIEITNAIKDTSINGIEIKNNDFMLIVDGDIAFSNASIEETLKTAMDYLITKESDLITFLVGADGDMDLANKMVEFVEEKSPFIEVEIMDTNQPIYSYLISGIK